MARFLPQTLKKGFLMFFKDTEKGSPENMMRISHLSCFPITYIQWQVLLLQTQREEMQGWERENEKELGERRQRKRADNLCSRNASHAVGVSCSILPGSDGPWPRALPQGNFQRQCWT